MHIRQRIFKCFTMQICRFFFTAFWNFRHITRLSTTNHRWVINAQTGPVYLAYPVRDTCRSTVCHYQSCDKFITRCIMRRSQSWSVL